MKSLIRSGDSPKAISFFEKLKEDSELKYNVVTLYAIPLPCMHVLHRRTSTRAGQGVTDMEEVFHVLHFK